MKTQVLDPTEPTACFPCSQVMWSPGTGPLRGAGLWLPSLMVCMQQALDAVSAFSVAGPPRQWSHWHITAILGPGHSYTHFVHSVATEAPRGDMDTLDHRLRCGQARVPTTSPRRVSNPLHPLQVKENGFQPSSRESLVLQGRQCLWVGVLASGPVQEQRIGKSIMCKLHQVLCPVGPCCPETMVPSPWRGLRPGCPSH